MASSKIVERNRRQLERFTMNVPTNVNTSTQEHPDQMLPTTNISSGGVFFETDKVYPVGTKVFLNIALDFGNGNATIPASRFKVDGTVVRTEPNGMAIALDSNHVSSIRVPSSKKNKLGPSMIGIVGSDPLLNDLLAARLSQETGVSCSHSQSMAKLIETARPDITLLDCTNLSVLSLMEEMGGDGSIFAATSVALFNVSDDRSVELEAINYGVRGVFYRATSFKVLTKGIGAILNNELWFSREAMSTYLLGKQKKDTEIIVPAEDDSEELSQREKEILLMLAAGATNKHIADELFLSLNTIKSHIYNIYRKIDVPNRLQASLWAAKYLRGEEHSS